MSCTNCLLSESCITNLIPNKGTGKILIVLEAPTGEQDLNGDISTGLHGRLLTGILKDAGLREEDYTLTSALRCGIPKHYTTTNESIEACRGHLRSIIQLVKPTKIIAIGDIALKACTRKAGIKGKRGSSFPLHAEFEYSCEVYPTYSITDIQRVPTYKRVVLTDIRDAVRIDTEPEEVDFEFWEVGNQLPLSTMWAWDIETAECGAIVDYPTMLSAGSVDRIFVAVGADRIRSLARALADSPAELITHNGYRFDIPVMKKWGIEMPIGQDTMYLGYMEDETQSLGLESLAVKYLNVKGWKTDGDWSKFDPTSLQAAQYAARDARYTLQLFGQLSAILGIRMDTLRKIIIPARIALDKQTERGIYIDPTAVSRERINAVSAREAALTRLQTMVSTSFNPNSNAQVGAYLQHQQRIRLPLTATGKPAVGVQVLNGINTDFARTLLDYRRATKTLSTYVDSYQILSHTGDGRVHPDYTLIRTLTGRSSARNLNVQNLPRQYKDFFGAPPGRCFVEADFSAIEFRVAAWLAREQTILDAYNDDPDWDPHRFVASLFYRRAASDITKAERQIAKSANFGLLYLGNGMTLYEYAAKMGVSIGYTEAEELYRFFHNTFPGFKRFYGETKEELKRTGQSKCPTGHIRHFGEYELLLPAMRLEALRQAVNVKVQNTAAHIAYIALAELDRRNVPHIGFVHDSFFFEFISESAALDAMDSIRDCMTEHPRRFLEQEFGIILDIPLRIEVKMRVNNE